MKKSTFLLLLTPILLFFLLLNFGCLLDDFKAENGLAVCQFVPERQDDFAWENDLTAWRAYGPAVKEADHAENAGLDIWLKAVDYPVMKKLYFEALKLGKSYHDFRGEAYDPYHVGCSLGLGGSAILYKKSADAPESFLMPDVFTKYEIVKEQGDAIEFKLFYTYANNAVFGEGKTIQEIKTFTLAKGSYFQKIEVAFTVSEGLQGSFVPVIGFSLQKSKGDAAPKVEILKQEQNLLTVTQKLGAENKDRYFASLFPLNGIWTPVQSVNETPDTSHLYLKANENVLQYSYCVGYGWNQAVKPIKNADAWTDALSDAQVQFLSK